MGSESANDSNVSDVRHNSRGERTIRIRNISTIRISSSRLDILHALLSIEKENFLKCHVFLL